VNEGVPYSARNANGPAPRERVDRTTCVLNLGGHSGRSGPALRCEPFNVGRDVQVGLLLIEQAKEHITRVPGEFSTTNPTRTTGGALARELPARVP
jgi:hypothetical protein